LKERRRCDLRRQPSADRFFSDDIDMLGSRQRRHRHDNARLYQVAVEKGRGAWLQGRGGRSNLLPQSVPSFPGQLSPGGSRRSRSAATSTASSLRRLAGRPISDVPTRHAAALFMASTRSVVRANIAASDDPQAALRLANQTLCADAPNGMFVTLLLLQLAGDGGRIRLANAGNNRPLLYRSERDEFVDFGSTGLPLAIDPAFPYTQQETFWPGDFFLYTDGLTAPPTSARPLRPRAPAGALWSAPLASRRHPPQLRLARPPLSGPCPYDDVTSCSPHTT
jgi:sigma-B regulation protein RsbU (phosphoserine phosphatase)